MAAINLPAIASELRPGLMAITGKYDAVETDYATIFSKRTSTMAYEVSSEMRFLGPAQIKAEGQAIPFDNQAGDRFRYAQEHAEFALGYAVTQKAMEDNQYKQQFATSNLGLQRSFRVTKEIMAAAVLNNAGVYDTRVGGDSQPLCSTAHPIDGSSYANRPAVDVDLGESTLLSAMSSIRTNYRDQAGIKVMARPKRLIVAPANEAVAIRLTKSELRPGTSDNDVNAIKTMAGGLVGGYIVLDYLTSPYAWFVQTDIDGLLWLQRVPFSTDMQPDFITGNLMVKGRERYSFGYNDPRCLWGTFPTS